MGRDVLGWRKLLGVMGPSTNTVVQPDFDMMRPAGVTNHYSRIYTPNADAVSNETFRAGAELIGANTFDAVRSVMTCGPDYLVMGMSAVTFFDGAKGADRFIRQIPAATDHGSPAPDEPHHPLDQARALDRVRKPVHLGLPPAAFDEGCLRDAERTQTVGAAVARADNLNA